MLRKKVLFVVLLVFVVAIFWLLVPFSQQRTAQKCRRNELPAQVY